MFLVSLNLVALRLSVHPRSFFLIFSTFDDESANHRVDNTLEVEKSDDTSRNELGEDDFIWNLFF